MIKNIIILFIILLITNNSFAEIAKKSLLMEIKEYLKRLSNYMEISSLTRIIKKVI